MFFEYLYVNRFWGVSDSDWGVRLPEWVQKKSFALTNATHILDICTAGSGAAPEE